MNASRSIFTVCGRETPSTNSSSYKMQQDNNLAASLYKKACIHNASMYIMNTRFFIISPAIS